MIEKLVVGAQFKALCRRDTRLKGRTAMPKLAADLTMLFNEVDFLDRFAVAASPMREQHALR
jgi:hypothetical protein